MDLNALTAITARPALITIVLTTCDRPQLLERAVASVLRQDDPRWALIVVDDGAEAMCWRPPDDPRIACLRTAGRTGAARARNLGMTRAMSDWMVLLDDDDEMEAGWVSHFIGVVARQAQGPAFALADWRILDYGPDGDVARERRRTYAIGDTDAAQNIQQALRAGACGLAVNQAALAAAGPMDPHYALTEDTEWILRLIEARCLILYAQGPGFIIHNRQTPDQLSSTKHFSDRVAECRQLQARYGDLGGRFTGLAGLFNGLIDTYSNRARAAG